MRFDWWIALFSGGTRFDWWIALFSGGRRFVWWIALFSGGRRCDRSIEVLCSESDLNV